MSTFVRSDQAVIQVTLSNMVTGAPITLPPALVSTGWTSIAGGDIERDDVTVRPSASTQYQNLGGVAKRSDCTVAAVYSLDLDNFLSTLEQAGNVRTSMSWTLTDANGNPNGNPHTITGVLKAIKRPDFNSESPGRADFSITAGTDV
jgi:hypothetical protein